MILKFATCLTGKLLQQSLLDAVRSGKTSKQTSNEERTEWVRCVSFGKLAEIMGEYLRKGSFVYVSGKMQTKKVARPVRARSIHNRDCSF